MQRACGWRTCFKWSGVRGAAAMLSLALHCQGPPAQGQIPCKYEVEIIPKINCGAWQQGMILTAINNHGECIGWSYGCGDPSATRSFTWNGGPSLTQLPIPPGSIGFRATDLNDNNLICGWADYTNGQHRAWVYNRNTNVWTQIPPVNTAIGWSEATALNNAGLVVGYRGIGNQIQGKPFNAFIFDSGNGALIDLGVMSGPHSAAGAISENGIVVGSTGDQYYEGPSARAFVHIEGVTTILEAIPGGINSNGVSVNSKGEALIFGILDQPGPHVSRTSLYKAGIMEPLAVPRGFDRVAAKAITQAELIVGSCNNVVDNEFFGFLWYGSQYAAVNALVNPSSGVTRIAVTRINETRQLAGDGLFNNEGWQVRLTPGPFVNGDATCDDFVNVNDLLAVINTWGPCSGCRPDLDLNGVVNAQDLFVVLKNWGNSP